MSRYGRGGRGGSGPRQGAKQITKANRYAVLDPDIVSNYDDQDDEITVTRPRRREERGGSQHVRDGIRTLVTQARLRTNYLSAAGKNSEIVNKIKVLNGRRYGERWVIQQLNKQEIEDFKPISITTNPKGEIEFYLKSDDATDAIKAISRRIIHQKTGDRVTFKIERCPAPWTRLSKQEIDIINEVVDSRYNEASKAIDLSEFFLDPLFKAKDMHMLLNKNNVLLSVLDRIDEKFGNITALSLKGNRLRFLDFSAMLVYIAKFVTVLDLSDNMIDSIEQLSKLRGMPVKMLFFEGNPVCEQLTRSSDYLNAVHQVFPKVIKLDGQDVPPSAIQANPDDEDDLTTEIPPRPGFYYNDDDVRQLVETFIIAYFDMYDGTQGATTRKQLIPAYDDSNSTFTLTMQTLGDSEPVRYSNTENYNFLIRTSHNIVQQEKWEKYRASKIFKGSMEIAVQIAKMPLTNHYRESFIVDVHLKTDGLLGFTLQGLFEEGPFAPTGSVPVLHYFSRSFYVAPREGSSVAIISDMLFISAITTDRMARYKLFMNKCLSNGPAASTSASAPTSTPHNVVPDEIKKAMVEQFCKDSGMLAEWSTKCLEDSEWQYEVAGNAFITLKQAGQIPAEAFST